jgi:hypothetical protein
VERIKTKMRIAKSLGSDFCRFIAKPFLFLKVFAGTDRSKQGKLVIMRTVEMNKDQNNDMFYRDGATALTELIT